MAAGDRVHFLCVRVLPYLAMLAVSGCGGDSAVHRIAAKVKHIEQPILRGEPSLRGSYPNVGALLMEAGDYDEAESVYRADLGLDEKLPRPSQHPRNVWALHGLHECLVRRGEKVELQHVKLLLDQAVARADIPILASCLCRAGAACH